MYRNVTFKIHQAATQGYFHPANIRDGASGGAWWDKAPMIFLSPSLAPKHLCIVTTSITCTTFFFQLFSQYNRCCLIKFFGFAHCQHPLTAAAPPPPLLTWHHHWLTLPIDACFDFTSVSQFSVPIMRPCCYRHRSASNLGGCKISA